MKTLVVPLAEHGHIIPFLDMCSEAFGRESGITVVTTIPFRSEVLCRGFTFLPLITTAGEVVQGSGSAAWMALRGCYSGAAIADVYFAAIERVTCLADYVSVIVDYAIIRSASKRARFVPGHMRCLVVSTSLPSRYASRHAFISLAPIIFLAPEFLEFPELRLKHPDVLYTSIRSRACPATLLRDDRQESETYIGISFGSQVLRYTGLANVLSTIADAAPAVVPHEQRLLLPSSTLPEAFLPAHLSDRFTLVANTRNESILRNAEIFVTHGGLGGIKSAIMQEVPMIVVPFLYDQPDNACRVHATGLGLFCSPSMLTSTRFAHLAKLVKHADIRDAIKRAASAVENDKSSGNCQRFIARHLQL